MLHGFPDTREFSPRKALARATLPLRDGGRFLADLLYPPRCSLCRTPVESVSTLCPPCFASLRFVGNLVCDCCGHPLPVASPGDLCGACLAEKPPYARARAVLHYDDASRPLVTRLKYGDKHHLLPLLGRWLQVGAAPLLTDAEMILPVPLHWRRYLKRRYNQSELLARMLSRSSGLPLDLSLRRRKPTLPQVGLSRKARERNVAHAFAVPKAAKANLAGKRVLLVDDVMTSGATLQAATRTLLRAGAAEVSVLTLSRRVLHDSGNFAESEDYA